MIESVKGYKSLNAAEKTRDQIISKSRLGWEIGQEQKGIAVKIVQRVWSDNRYVVIVICNQEVPGSLQFGLTLAHAGINCYISDLPWLTVELLEKDLTDEQIRNLGAQLDAKTLFTEGF